MLNFTLYILHCIFCILHYLNSEFRILNSALPLTLLLIMTITISASKEDVYAEVDIFTAYIGGKSGLYDTIPTIDADRPLIDVLWRDAKTWAIAGMSATIESDLSSKDKAVVTVSVDDNRPASMLEPLLRSALARYIIARWLQICNIESSETHFEQALSSLGSLKRQSHAQYPTSRPIPPI